MRKRNKPEEFRLQVQFLRNCVSVFLNNSDITDVAVSNDYGYVAFSRTRSSDTVARAIGFTSYFDDSDDEV